jgi:hypothetical protein
MTGIMVLTEASIQSSVMAAKDWAAIPERMGDVVQLLE